VLDALTRRVAHELAGGRVDAAIAAVRLHLKIKPRDLAAGRMLGSLLQTAGRFDQAVQHLDRMVAMHPDDLESRYELGQALMGARRWQDARAQFEGMLARDPDSLSAYIMLTLVHVELGETTKAIEAGRRAMQLGPGIAAAAGNLLFALSRAGEAEEAVHAAGRCLELNPHEHKLRSMMLYTMNNLSMPAESVSAAHREYGKFVGPPQRITRTTPDPARPIRIGFLSGDFRDHSVAFFLEPILAHAPSWVKFEAFSNCGTLQRDATQERLRGYMEAWHECGTLTHESIESRIRTRDIDVLIELGGHSGEPRLLALANKPAPVIISAIGYPNTTGLPAVDWRVVDSITDPPGSEHLCTERLLRLDPCFLCYSPPQEAPEPALPADDAPITFGSFNNAAKIGPTSIDLWARVLKAVPGSRLLLKSQTLSDAAGRARIERRFVEAGIEASRLELVAYSKTRQEHLELYRRVHVALDTTPYNGTTTTCEALWMGVPVITTLGDRHAARVSASLLHACGHPELVAKDAEAFVQLASTLAQDRARLATLRASLRGELRASPLCDAPAYAARFHAAIRDCWKQWCARQAG
jgi:predicted O-linked N-acetylglucosamine transferase (SPINDLY family)